MIRFSREQLVDKALLALREAIEEVGRREGSIERSRHLRFVLAFLYTGGDRRPFDQFWEAATRGTLGQKEVMAIHFGRRQTMRSCLAAISRLHGVEPW